jgi:hypothetical protein
MTEPDRQPATSTDAAMEMGMRLALMEMIGPPPLRRPATARQTPSTSRTALGPMCLLLAGALFVLYPALRPWTDESTAEGAQAAMESTAWVASHGFAMVGFVLLGLGLLPVWGVLQHTRAEPVALAAMVTGWVGAGLVLPYLGAETFESHAIAWTTPYGLLEVVDAVRYQPFATAFGIGLVVLTATGVLLSIAGFYSRVIGRAPAVLTATGLATYLPQFFTPTPVRIAHGVLLSAGLSWLALSLWHTRVALRQ